MYYYTFVCKTKNRLWKVKKIKWTEDIPLFLFNKTGGKPTKIEEKGQKKNHNNSTSNNSHSNSSNYIAPSIKFNGSMNDESTIPISNDANPGI